MVIKFKRLNDNAVAPSRAYDGDACYDLVAVSKEIDENNNFVYHFGLALEIPKGYVGLVFPRSSICKKDQFLTNAVGVIDSGYRGEITAKFKPVDISGKCSVYEPLDKIAQLMIVELPDTELVETDELTPSERGERGYGSSDK